MKKRKVIIRIAAALLVFALCGCTAQSVPVSQPEVLSAPVESIAEESSHQEKQEVEKGPVICLDAGHGFDDPGCESEYMIGWEKEITLDITMLLKQKLEAAGAEVILTHDGKDFPSKWIIREYAKEYGVEFESDRMADNNIFSAYERGIYVAALHKESPIDLFLSLHINSAEDYPQTSRYEFYYFEENRAADLLWEFGNAVAAQMDNEMRVLPTEPNDTYYVTKYTDAPAALFEMGYATNKEDADRLNSAAWRDRMCDILTEQIMAYFGEKTA